VGQRLRPTTINPSEPSLNLAMANFDDLSPELRNKIYEHFFQGVEVRWQFGVSKLRNGETLRQLNRIYPRRDPKTNPADYHTALSSAVALLCSAKWVYAETSAIFSAQARFNISNLWSTPGNSTLTCCPNFGQLLHIQMHFDIANSEQSSHGGWRALQLLAQSPSPQLKSVNFYGHRYLRRYITRGSVQNAACVTCVGRPGVRLELQAEDLCKVCHHKARQQIISDMESQYTRLPMPTYFLGFDIDRVENSLFRWRDTAMERFLSNWVLNGRVFSVLLKMNIHDEAGYRLDQVSLNSQSEIELR
jgi:hypothetical protein